MDIHFIHGCRDLFTLSVPRD
ncbi:hypothetical protein KIPB_015422, partial [Kipferlia bialata]|eukprot:g15422.t1